MLVFTAVIADIFNVESSDSDVYDGLSCCGNRRVIIESCFGVIY